MPIDPNAVVTGTLHLIVSYDWCNEINLDLAAQLAPAQLQALSRRPRTPPTIGYRPPPLRFELPPTRLTLPEIGELELRPEAIVFDFGAANVVLRSPFRLSLESLKKTAAGLADVDWLLAGSRRVATPLFEKLRPAMKDAQWNDLSEEYFIFQINPGDALPPAAELVEQAGETLAAILRLDDQPLCREEIEEALRMRISYRPQDVVLVEWSAAIVVDDDCDETIQAIEFANLQLLEFRFIDRKVDDALAEAQRQIRPPVRAWLPLARPHARPLRVLSEMRIDTVGTFERASSALVLVGDQYLARVYRLLAARFRLDDWAASIRRSLDVAEGVHDTLSSESSMFRLELLEAIVVLLILLEIVLAFAGH